MRLITVLSAIILGFPSICYGQSYNRGVNFGVDIRWINFDIQRSNMEVLNVPESLRKVPVHSKDIQSGLENTVTIASDTIRPGMFVFYSPTVAPQVSVGRITARAGVSMIIPLAPNAVSGNRASTRQIPYEDTGNLGGDSRPKAYYAVEVASKVKFGWLGEIEYQANHRFSFLGGYSVSRYDIQVTNGWDRNGILSVHNENRISSNLASREYLGLRIKRGRDFSVLLLGGIYSEKSEFSPSAGEMAVNYPISYFFSTSMSISVGSGN